VQDTVRNVAIAINVMVTNCSAQRTFSKLELIENRLRTSTTQERLVNLAIVTSESNTLRDTDFTVIISDFAVAKSSKVSSLKARL